MPHRNRQAVPGAQAFRSLLGEENGAMLAAGAAKRNHQVFEAALLIAVDARIHQRQDAGEKLMHALLLIEIVDHRGVFAGKSLEALFASRIGEAAAIENEPAAISSLVFRQVLVKRKTENPNDQVFGFGSEALQFFRGQHTLEGVHQRRKGDGEPDVVKEPAEIFQGVGHALQKMSLALIKTAKDRKSTRLNSS